MENYDLLRMDRSRMGGGIACCIRKSLSYSHNIKHNRDIKSTFIDIILPKSKPTLVGVLSAT